MGPIDQTVADSRRNIQTPSWTQITSALTPILNNPDFGPGMLDADFNFWLNKGIRRLND